MHQTAAADADRGRRPAAPAELDAAADDVGGIRPWRDIEQKAGKDEKPEFMNAEHDRPSNRLRSAIYGFHDGGMTPPNPDCCMGLAWCCARIGLPSATRCL